MIDTRDNPTEKTPREPESSGHMKTAKEWRTKLTVVVVGLLVFEALDYPSIACLSAYRISLPF
ncbi:MAG: hypothetical protein QGI34_18635 [Candidatus Latescibacteria bacterium]|jgi:hypothetical protein|nr:hypothetical protein [Candidatus Latescibacterota bacterium]|tara:strand:+ start:109 stop:297 length:189 start_codon:yes stop_codon:yes gene_type:complete